MRELKFRAWDNKAKEWLLGYGYGELGGFSLFGECMLLGEWSHVLNEFILQQKYRTPDDLIIMQYTGLKDGNEKEVYEGDIVVLPADQRCVVIWDTLGFHAMAINPPKDYPIDYRYFTIKEVIGNVYENPNLLK